jgi:hypothetical protein
MMVGPIRLTPRQHRTVPIEYEALGPRASLGVVKVEGFSVFNKLSTTS